VLINKVAWGYLLVAPVTNTHAFGHVSCKITDITEGEAHGVVIDEDSVPGYSTAGVICIYPNPPPEKHREVSHSEVK